MSVNYLGAAGRTGGELMYVGVALFKKTTPIPSASSTLSLGLSLATQVNAVENVAHLISNFGPLQREHVSTLTQTRHVNVNLPDNGVRVPLRILRKGLDYRNLSGTVNVAYAGAGITDKDIPRTLSDLSILLCKSASKGSEHKINIEELLKPNRYNNFRGKPLFVRSIPTKVDLSGVSAWIGIGDHKKSTPAIYFYVNVFPWLDDKLNDSGDGKLVLTVDLPMLKFANMTRTKVLGDLG
jgi:hypothetical protein